MSLQSRTDSLFGPHWACLDSIFGRIVDVLRGGLHVDVTSVTAGFKGDISPVYIAVENPVSIMLQGDLWGVLFRDPYAMASEVDEEDMHMSEPISLQKHIRPLF